MARTVGTKAAAVGGGAGGSLSVVWSRGRRALRMRSTAASRDDVAAGRW